MALTSWPAGRLTLASPAAPQDLLSEKGLPPGLLGLSFPRCFPPGETLSLFFAHLGSENIFFLGENHIT